MGQKVNPIANRLGIIRGWDSNWFGGKDFSEKLVEDAKIRKYLNVRLAKASISKIIIERTLKLVTVTISTARPGIIIGKGGQEVDKLKEELKKLTGKEIQINIFEVKRPEVDAVIVGQNIARQLEGRVSFRRAVKTAVASTMRMGAEGIKIQVSGRVGGAEMARSETIKDVVFEAVTMALAILLCNQFISSGLPTFTGDYEDWAKTLIYLGEMTFTVALTVGTVKGAQNLTSRALGL